MRLDRLEIHVDAIKPGDKVLVVDDLLATGNAIEATVKLIVVWVVKWPTRRSSLTW